MTLLSFIAIIASILAGVEIFFSCNFFQIEPKKDASRWKRIKWDMYRKLSFDKISAHRRMGLKIILSVLIAVAFGCGFWDAYSTNTLEHQGFWYILLSLVLSGASLCIVLVTCVFGGEFKEVITSSRFEFGEGSWKSVAINICYLCIWVAMFIFLIWYKMETVFCTIALSLALAAGVSFLLTLLGFFIYLIYLVCSLILICPLIAWIKWLRE